MAHILSLILVHTLVERPQVLLRSTVYSALYHGREAASVHVVFSYSVAHAMTAQKL